MRKLYLHPEPIATFDGYTYCIFTVKMLMQLIRSKRTIDVSVGKERHIVYYERSEKHKTRWNGFHINRYDQSREYRLIREDISDRELAKELMAVMNRMDDTDDDISVYFQSSPKMYYMVRLQYYQHHWVIGIPWKIYDASYRYSPSLLSTYSEILHDVYKVHVVVPPNNPYGMELSYYFTRTTENNQWTIQLIHADGMIKEVASTEYLMYLLREVSVNLFKDARVYIYHRHTQEDEV